VGVGGYGNRCDRRIVKSSESQRNQQVGEVVGTRSCYTSQMSSLDRKHVRIYRSLAEADDDGYMPGSPEERLSQVWELTQEAWSFFQGAHAEQRLQRDVAVLIRRKS
jgi:hypothetical protein